MVRHAFPSSQFDLFFRLHSLLYGGAWGNVPVMTTSRHLEFSFGKWSKLHSFRSKNRPSYDWLKCCSQWSFVLDINERQVALSVLESLRDDLTYARLNNGSRVLDLADLRQYIYEQMGRIRTNAHVTAALYGNSKGHGQDISKRNGHNGQVHP